MLHAAGERHSASGEGRPAASGPRPQVVERRMIHNHFGRCVSILSYKYIDILEGLQEVDR